MSHNVLVRLLGPVDVLLDGAPRPVSGLRRKAVLAVLGLSAGEVVSTDRLLDIVWDGRSSTVTLNALQTHISYLRRMLGSPDTIVARASGYVLDLGPETTDLQVAVRLIEQSRQDTSPDQQVAGLRAALDLWRDRPLTDVTGLTWLDAQAERLTTLQVDAMLSLIEARLALGEHAELVTGLDELVRQHPYREDVGRQLMLALYRSGRQAEALAAYQELRLRLADELGIDPGTALRELEAAILRQDPAIAALAPIATVGTVGSGDAGAVTDDAPVATRRRDVWSAGAANPLPADTGLFTGRVHEAETIIAGVTAAAGHGRMMSVHAIDGMPGVGKTALAIHVAQRLAERLEGQSVFVDLHGHTAGRSPTDPAEVLAVLLSADGLDPRQLPDGVEARSAVWRQRMADRPLLMVLDNAMSSDQVEPLLLPPSSGSVVLVTSRRFLGDLPAYAITVSLDVLSPDEARGMFLRLAPRAMIDPDGVDDLIALGGYLPLAIALLARLLTRHRTWTVSDVVAETRARLITLTAEDRTVAAAFDLSYHHLGADRQRFFRRLGLHPGTEIDPYAAAALAGVPWAEANRHLDALHTDNLIVEVSYRRYAMHDLIRLYVGGLADIDPGREHAEARAALVDFYRYTATAADARLTRYTRPTSPGEPQPTPTTGMPDVSGVAQALTWIRTERDNLLAVLAVLAEADDPERLVELTSGLTELLRRDGPWPEAIAAHERAAGAAERLGDRLGQANALADLATTYRLSGNNTSGERAAQQALEIYRALGNRLGEANALTCLGNIWRMDIDYQAAGGVLEQALVIYDELGDRLGRANALTALGTIRYILDDYPAAAGCLRTAAMQYREIGDRLGEAHALTYLGEVLRVSSDYAAATDTLFEALSLHRDVDDRLGQANTLNYLGSVHSQTGDRHAADQAWKEALDLYRQLGDRLGQGHVLDSLAQAHLDGGNHAEATRAAQEALDRYRDVNNRHGQASALMRLGRIRVAIGDHRRAGPVLHEALDAYRRLGDRSGEAEVLSDLGAMYRLAGDVEAGRKHHVRALQLAEQINSQWDEAHAWAGIGRCDLAAGQAAAAVEHLGNALAIFQRIGAAEAAEVAADLEAAAAPELSA